MSQKVVLGLSGGVDSAVSAKLLRDRRFEITGLFLDIGNEKARNDAHAAAEFLKIPLSVLDIRSELELQVCAPFVEAYLRGETPNPCIICNPSVKFKALLGYADDIGADFVATGHYAKISDGQLYKGCPANDQSYMLYRLPREYLSRIIFPLGDFEKAEVREMADGIRLPLANKPDSMEICFIPDDDYAAYIESRGLRPAPGNFVSPAGEVLGRHRGIHRYTVGQRRGLGIAAGKRVFVLEVRPETNEVVLSDDEFLYVDEVSVHSVNWLIPKSDAFKAEAKVRHSRVQTPATVYPDVMGKSARLSFDVPVRAPAKGQSAVFYVDNKLIGGGFIE